MRIVFLICGILILLLGVSLIESGKTESVLEDAGLSGLWENLHMPIIENSGALPMQETGVGTVLFILGLILTGVGFTRRSTGGYESGLLYQKLKHIHTGHLEERLRYLERNGAALESPYKKKEAKSFLMDLPVENESPAASQPTTEPTGTLPDMSARQVSHRPVSPPAAHAAAGHSTNHHPYSGNTVGQIPASTSPGISPSPSPDGAADLMTDQDALNRAVRSVSAPGPAAAGKGATGNLPRMRNFRCSSCQTTFSLRTDRDEILCPGCGTRYKLPE